MCFALSFALRYYGCNLRRCSLLDIRRQCGNHFPCTTIKIQTCNRHIAKLTQRFSVGFLQSECKICTKGMKVCFLALSRNSLLERSRTRKPLTCAEVQNKAAIPTFFVFLSFPFLSTSLHFLPLFLPLSHTAQTSSFSPFTLVSDVLCPAEYDGM